MPNTATAPPSSPTWLDLAATFIDGLQRQSVSSEDKEEFALDAQNKPEGVGARLKRVSLAESLPAEALDAMIADGEDPYATPQSGSAAPPTDVPNLFNMIAAVRLARTLADHEGLARVTAPRALHILETADEVVAEYVDQVLTVAHKGPRKAALTSLLGMPQLMVIRQPRDGRDRRSWSQRLPNYIGRPNALLFVCLNARDLPPELYGAATKILSLAPLGAEGLLLLLERLHSSTGQVARAALRARMPDPETLARLPAMTVAAAFRAPTTFAVVDRLAEAGRPRSPTRDLTLLEGMGELEQSARNLVEDFIGYQQGRVAWSDMTRSLILNGPPGVGKTFAAGLIAKAAGAHLVTGTVGQWQSAGHLGDMLREMRATFAAARAATPSILFVDEVDGLGSRADDGDRNAGYRRQVVNEFLNLMNGMSDQEGCLVIAATNDVSQLDPAIVRPGRFDQIIQVPLPGPTAVTQILRHHLRGTLDVDTVQDLARQARGRTAADIEAAVRAARGSARRAGVPLTAGHVAAALAPRSEMPESLTWRIAVHEAGHALVAHLLGVGRVEAVRLTPDGGLTTLCVAHSEGLPGQIEAALAYQLGGRAAERLVLDGVGSGSGGPEHSDLARATRGALEAELTLGSGATGLVWLPPDTRHLANLQLRERVAARLEAAEARAFAVLHDVRPALEDIARALVQARVLEGWTLQLMLNAASQAQTQDPEDMNGTVSKAEQPFDEEDASEQVDQPTGSTRT